jgi:porin
MRRLGLLILVGLTWNAAIGQLRADQQEPIDPPLEPETYAEQVEPSVDECAGCCQPSCCWDAFELDVVYTADTFSNTKGGEDTGTNFEGLVDVVLRTDLAALGFDTVGGTFVLHGQNKHGPSLNRLVGATQSTNIDADPFTAMAEYYWERPVMDDLAVWRIGRQVGAIHFSVLDLAADFTYGGFQKSPNNPLPWYPNPTLAATVEMTLTDSFDLSIGAFNGGEPDQLTSWGWSEEGKVYTIGELRYHYSIAGLPGDLQGGLWYTSGSHEEVDGNDDFHGNHGAYMGWDQLLVTERCDPEQGLGTFFIYSWAPSDRNEITNHFATGVLYRGPLNGRDSDEIGAGLNIADFSNELDDVSSENTIEVFYLAQINDNVFVQPVVYYVASPSGDEPDALVAGFRFAWEM